MVTGGPNAWSLNCTQPPYRTDACRGLSWMPTGRLFCTWTTTWHPAASAAPAVASNAIEPIGTATTTAPIDRLSLLTGPWCPRAPSPARPMAGEVDDLLERRAGLPVDRTRSDDAGGHGCDVVEALVVGQLVDRGDVLGSERALDGSVQRPAQRGPAGPQRPAVRRRGGPDDRATPDAAENARHVAVPGDAVPRRAKALSGMVVDPVGDAVDEIVQHWTDGVLRQTAVGLAVVVPPRVEQRDRGLVAVMARALAVDAVGPVAHPSAQHADGGGIPSVVADHVEGEWQQLLRPQVDRRGVDHRADESGPRDLAAGEQRRDPLDEQVDAVHRAVAPLVVGHPPSGRLLVVPGAEESGRRVHLVRVRRGRQPALPVVRAVTPAGEVRLDTARTLREQARHLVGDVTVVGVEPVERVVDAVEGPDEVGGAVRVAGVVDPREAHHRVGLVAVRRPLHSDGDRHGRRPVLGKRPELHDAVPGAHHRERQLLGLAATTGSRHRDSLVMGERLDRLALRSAAGVVEIVRRVDRRG